MYVSGPSGDMSVERERVTTFGKLEDGLGQASDWYLWGPYVSERQWGTVREDYSADGEAWNYFPHDHARSRAYRWGEDGLAGFLRHPPATVSRTGALEWPRPDSEGTHLRPDRARRAITARTPRSTGGTWTRCPATPGTGGGTTTPSRHSRTSTHRRKRPARQAGPGVRAPGHRRVRRRPLLDRRRVVTPKADPARRVDARAHDQRGAGRPKRCTCCQPPGSATPGRGTTTSRSH